MNLLDKQTPKLDLMAVLGDRGERYGEFEHHAAISQKLKDVMRATPKWDQLSPSAKESLEMIQHKIARVLNGDPAYDDSWVDIAGYAELQVKIIRGVGI